MVISPSRAEVRAAVEGLPQDLSWENLRDSLRPVFVRRRPLPPGMVRPAVVRRPPGLTVGLGVDIGPAFMYVGEPWLEDWGVSADEAFEHGLANLRAAVLAERYFELEYGTIGEVPFWWYQSEHGLASGLLLVEDELQKRYGDEPRLLIAPMRNLLLVTDYGAERELVEWVRDEISAEDPNGLDLPVFALVEGKLTIEAPSGAALTHVH